jgi:hypothetical protein
VCHGAEPALPVGFGLHDVGQYDDVHHQQLLLHLISFVASIPSPKGARRAPDDARAAIRLSAGFAGVATQLGSRSTSADSLHLEHMRSPISERAGSPQRAPARRGLRSYALAVVVAAVLAAALTRSAAGSGRVPASSAIPADVLPAALRGRYGVLVLFQPGDCGGYRDFIEAVAVMAHAAGVPVVGTPIRAPSDPGKLRTAMRRLDPPFSLAPRAANATSRSLWTMGYKHTPVALVVDPQGRPVMVLPPEAVPYHQAREMEAAGSYLVARRSGGVFP